MLTFSMSIVQPMGQDSVYHTLTPHKLCIFCKYMQAPTPIPDSAVGFLTQKGFAIPMATMRARLGARMPALLKKLTITHHQKVGPPLVARMYTMGELAGVPCIFIPRTLCTLMSRIMTIRNYLPAEVLAAYPDVDVYENQRVIIDYLMPIFSPERREAGTATCILNLRPGMGKTFVAAGLISRLGLRTLYIVPKRPLMVQTVKDLRGCLVGANVGAYGEKDDHDVTVIVINSACARDPAFFAGYSFVVLDEVHMYCSGARREIFRIASARCMIGMSGTTEDRTDCFDPIAHKELAGAGPDGDTTNAANPTNGVIRAENIPEFTYDDVVFDCHARIIRYNGPPDHTHNLTHESTGRIFTHYMHNQFIDDPYRLRLAVNELIALYDWRDDSQSPPRLHNIYVFAEEIDILRKAQAAFKAELAARRREDIIIGLDLPADIAGHIADNIEPATTGALGLMSSPTRMFTGGLADAQIADIVATARVLFSTYGYAGTGVSVPKMTAIMFLTPRMAAMKQIIPRVLRRGSDLTIPRVCVDFVDNKTALKKQLVARRAAYDFYGFKVVEVRVGYEDVAMVNAVQPTSDQ